MRSCASSAANVSDAQVRARERRLLCEDGRVALAGGAVIQDDVEWESRSAHTGLPTLTFRGNHNVFAPVHRILAMAGPSDSAFVEPSVAQLGSSGTSPINAHSTLHLIRLRLAIPRAAPVTSIDVFIRWQRCAGPITQQTLSESLPVRNTT